MEIVERGSHTTVGNRVGNRVLLGASRSTIPWHLEGTYMHVYHSKIVLLGSGYLEFL